MSLKLSRSGVFLAGLVVATFAFVAAGCGGDGGGGGPEALPSSACTAIEYEGDGNPDYIMVSDLPLQGSSRFQTEQINAAIRYALQQADWKAGDYNIGFQACDDATARSRSSAPRTLASRTSARPPGRSSRRRCTSSPQAHARCTVPAG